MGLIRDSDGGLKVVSMSDVVRHPLFKELSEAVLKVPHNNKKGREVIQEVTGLDAMLWTMGLNIFNSYESEVLEHRSELTQKVVTCERFVGSKRQDAAWKKMEYSLIKERDILA